MLNLKYNAESISAGIPGHEKADSSKVCQGRLPEVLGILPNRIDDMCLESISSP